MPDLMTRFDNKSGKLRETDNRKIYKKMPVFRAKTNAKRAFLKFGRGNTIRTCNRRFWRPRLYR